jgi:YVTN family beta-propeller protein
MFDTVAFELDRAREKALVLDLDSRKEIGEIAFGSPPGTAITAAAGVKLYVALTESNAVAVVDVQQSRLLKVIDGVGEKPWAVSSVGGLSYCH